MEEEKEEYKQEHKLDELLSLKEENKELKEENDELEEQNECLLSDGTGKAWEINNLNMRIERLSHENDLKEFKKLREKYKKLNDISKLLWSCAFDETIPVRELVPNGRHLNVFDMR